MDFRRATKDDVNDIYVLMHKAVDYNQDKTDYVVDDMEFIERHIEDEGFCLVCVSDNTMAGFVLLRFPKAASDNLAIDIFSKPLSNVCHIESIAVLDRFRGQRIGFELISKSEPMAVSMGYDLFVATVSPSNHRSLNMFLNQGYQIKMTKQKYGGRDRHILLKTYTKIPEK